MPDGYEFNYVILTLLILFVFIQYETSLTRVYLTKIKNETNFNDMSVPNENMINKIDLIYIYIYIYIVEFKLYQ